jgi:hypothetical protein
MVLIVHVSPRCALRLESHVARFAFVLWGPVTILVHVADCRVFILEFGIARLAGPVANGVHVLPGSVPVHECASATLAINHGGRWLRAIQVD